MPQAHTIGAVDVPMPQAHTIGAGTRQCLQAHTIGAVDLKMPKSPHYWSSRPANASKPTLLAQFKQQFKSLNLTP